MEKTREEKRKRKKKERRSRNVIPKNMHLDFVPVRATVKDNERQRNDVEQEEREKLLRRSGPQPTPLATRSSTRAMVEGGRR
jgi:hypothetical protein